MRSERWAKAVLTVAALGGASACGPPPRTAVIIEVDATAGGAELSCTTPLVMGGRVYQLEDLRFFVHDVRLVDERGRTVPVTLVDDGIWQHGGAALLDFAAGPTGCRNASPAVNRVLRGHAPPGRYRGLRFRVGVPAALNHGDPTIAAAPLSSPSMHWGWMRGYKFFRFDASSPDGGVELHLGSAACSGGPGGTIRCARENLAEVALDGVAWPRPRIRVDVGRLIERGLGATTAAHCASGIDEPPCAALYAALGLDPADGRVATPSPMFAVAP